MNIIENKDLSEQNSFGLKVKASKFIEIKSEAEALTFFESNSKNPFLVLGGGSNMLFTDDYKGNMLANRILGKEKIREDDQHVWLRCGAGEVWNEVVEFAVENGWGGIENLSLIPGRTGAAPIQNIGAYGVEIKEVLESVTCIVLPENEIKVFDNNACKFGYRDSVFKHALRNKCFITYVVIKLNKKHELKTDYGAIQEELKDIPEANRTIKDVAAAVVRIRQSKLPDPKVLGNAGSFFKNPVIAAKQYKQLKKTYSSMSGYVLPDGRVKVAAGWLIEYCGWKGHQVGNAGCHAKQALVIVNYGNATGAEIWKHAENVMESVWETFKIRLEPEVNIIR